MDIIKEYFISRRSHGTAAAKARYHYLKGKWKANTLTFQEMAEICSLSGRKIKITVE